MGDGGAAGDGGDGGAGDQAAGLDGYEENEDGNGSNSGGGGGGAGRIRINSRGASTTVTGNATFSPTSNLGDCTGLCSQAEVSLW